LILEVGIGKPGDMKKTASWLKTDAVIITAIGDTPSHIEFFNSREHLVEEKSKLIKTLKKDGLLILNADDESVLQMKSKTKSRFITYGFKEGADVLASGDNIFYDDLDDEPKGIIFRVDKGGSSLPVIIEGVFGRNHVYASLASLAFCYGQKLNMLEAVNMLKNYDVPPGRMHLLKGINDSLIIDDTYNSSPFACESGLKTFGQIKNTGISTGRKIAVLGDMLELGRHTEEAHKHIGEIAKENADILIVVGQRAKTMRTGALESGMPEENIFDFENSKEAAKFLKTMVQKNDLIFVKGSQGMRMERAVEIILLDKKNKNNLLVRQDPEWIAKK